MPESNAMATFDRPPVIERLHSNVGKRKSTTPQKFVGESCVKHIIIISFNYCGAREQVFDLMFPGWGVGGGGGTY